MTVRKLNLVLIAVTAAVVLGTIAQAASNAVLDHQKLSVLNAAGCSCYLYTRNCLDCLESGGTYYKCTRAQTYAPCIEDEGDPGDDCGSCSRAYDCGSYRECTGSRCTSCITTGSCDGCVIWTGDRC